MKYLKIFLVILAVVALIIGVWDVYQFVMLPKQEAGGRTVESPRPVIQDQKEIIQLISSEREYTTHDVPVGESIEIQGLFQADDSFIRVIGDITYTNVVGILGDDNVLHKVWMTENEYQSVIDQLRPIPYERRVRFVLRSDSIEISVNWD